MCRTLLVVYRALWVVCRALLVVYKALLVMFGALLVLCRTLLVVYGPFLVVCRALLVVCRALLVVCRALCSSGGWLYVAPLHTKSSENVHNSFESHLNALYRTRLKDSHRTCECVMSHI